MPPYTLCEPKPWDQADANYLCAALRKHTLISSCYVSWQDAFLCRRPCSSAVFVLLLVMRALALFRLQCGGQRWGPGVMHTSGFDLVDVYYCNSFWLTSVNTEEITEHEMRLISMRRHTHMQKYTAPAEFFAVGNKDWPWYWTPHVLWGFCLFSLVDTHDFFF